MEIMKYSNCGKLMTLYLSAKENGPLIILNHYDGDGQSVVDELKELGADDFNLLCIGNLNWDHDLTPWYCPPLSEKDTPCTGGADEYLDLLLHEIIPTAKEHIKGEPVYLGIAGYSLAGLFAVYAMYKTDAFDRVASMSGSLWFPEFKEYCMTHEIRRKPEKLYLSLGDKEAKSRNKVFKTVQENMQALIAYYKELGIDVTWELNPGNHFKEAALRSAKGIMAIIQN